jgi:cell division protein FtsB
MKFKSGRNEIVYLLAKVIEKHELQTGELVVRNTNRKNYEGVARKLSEISNALPNTAEELNHDHYPPDYNPKKLEYPFRKYDITASQVKDAFLGIVNNPRPFLVDACYLYLYGVGRKGFAENPQDANLFEEEEMSGEQVNPLTAEKEILQSQLATLKEEKEAIAHKARIDLKKQKMAFSGCLGFVLLVSLFFFYQWTSTRKVWEGAKKDLFILPYQPTKAEIDSLEGVWLSYTASPQARSSDPNRYHLVIANVLDVKYKDGYFTFNRYGASFDHVGYMQYDAPWLVSIHSFAKNNIGRLESPKHSLMRLEGVKHLIPVISASWNFDVGNQNKIIGIREVYSKQGTGGRIEEIINSPENVSCRCKIIKWHQDAKGVRQFYLRNELLDTLADQTLKNLLDEKSILPRLPNEVTVFSADTLKR